MSEQPDIYKLARLYDTAEDKDLHAKKILDNFLSLTKMEQLDVIDHYFKEVRCSEHMELIKKELFDEETIIKRHDQEVKLWLFKAIIVFGLVVIFSFIFVLDSLEHIDRSGAGNTTLENIIKFMAKLLFS
jgi:hypothetical protein